MLTARDERGVAVDWWFAYKLPAGVEPKLPGTLRSEGNEYLYYDPQQRRPLALSPHRLGVGPDGALYQTLTQLFGPAADGAALPQSVGWILYNDDYPGDLSPYQATSGATQAEETFAIDELKAQLIASWQRGGTGWPPRVKPRIESGRAAKSRRGRPRKHDENGHNKGVLAFDLASDTAFWLTHSTPRLPPLHTPESFSYPGYADQYAQTFLCVSLGAVETACALAKVMATQHEPQVFGCRLPEALAAAPAKDDPRRPLWELCQGSVPPHYSEAWVAKHGRREPSRLGFYSAGIGGAAPKPFYLLAKSGAWLDDFWIDLVGPSLPSVDPVAAKRGERGVDLRVETWRRLTPTALLPRDNVAEAGADPVYYGSHDFSTTYKGRAYHHEFLERTGHNVVDEVTNIDLRELEDPSGLLTGTPGGKLRGYSWSYTRDHAKWAISEEVAERGVKTVQLHDGTTLADEPGTVSDWVCVADINRMTSQERRGGGAVCFHEPLLWHGLNAIERISGKIT
jgi:deoxyribonuclease-2